KIAGFSPAEADDLRKAIGKKIHSLMASLKGKFLEGAASNGISAATANALWADMEQAQEYSFNKSHAACYALLAYRTAWLRAHHPAGREQARARVARQVRRARLDRRAPPRHARRARAVARLGAEAAVRQAARPGVDLRPRRAHRRRRAAAPSGDSRRRRVRQE